MTQRASKCRLSLVMYQTVNIVLVCLLAAIAGTLAAGNFYGKHFVTEDVEDALQVLGPLALLRRHQIVSSRSEKKVNSIAVGDTCNRDLGVLLLAVERREMWALKMLDASSKIQSGILEGNLIDIGMYDECISSRGKLMSVEIQGRHCMYSIVPNNDNGSLPLYPTLSICLPATCSATDLYGLFNRSIHIIDKLKNLGFTIQSVECSSVDPVVWDTEFTICFIILNIFIGFLVICSVCDLLYHSYGLRHSTVRVLSSFSLQKNAASIVSTKTGEGNLPSIHGIRFLSIAWITLGHQYVMSIFAPNVNSAYFTEWIQSWRSLLILTAPFAVDTFFTLSGFLMTFMYLKQASKQRIFNVPLYYVHRFIRLTPPVIALFVFSIVFLPKIGSGARWESLTSTFLGVCRAKWWPIFLYVQNFVDKDSLCLGHLWYLAVDMQLFWISPLILYPLHRKPKAGLIILLTLIVTSVVVPASIVGVNKYPVESFVHTPNASLVINLVQVYYEMPYNRAGAWLVGILLGYEMYSKKRTLFKTTIIIGWLSAVGCFAFCIFGTRSFIDPDYKYNAVWETFFAAVSRPTWATGVCWIIFASYYDCAGPVSKILNCKYFQPLSRLTYCIYLVHFVLQLLDVAALRTPLYFSDYNVLQAYLSKFTASIVIAFVFSLLFESPILDLEKMILKRNNEPQYEPQRDLGIPDDEALTS